MTRFGSLAVSNVLRSDSTAARGALGEAWAFARDT